MRYLLILLWVAAALVVLWPLLTRRRRRRTAVAAAADELVKDPVCQTYVVRSRAIRRPADDGTRYFCSVECARRWADD